MNLEAQRLENLKHKQKLLADLNLHSNAVPLPSSKRGDDERVIKKRKVIIENAPARSSARLASSGARPSYKEDVADRYNYVEPPSRSKSTKTQKVKRNESLEENIPILHPIADAETIRSGWTQWHAVAEPPTRDENGTLSFKDYPDFKPNKTPEEVIKEGCFGGSYFRPLKSRKLGILVEDDWKELPKSWYEGIEKEKFMISPIYDPEVNKFKVACGQSIEEWEANGWIAYEYDIRGWFQWYCRFYMGRRCEDDDRQVGRWKRCVGETGRWKRMLLKKYLQLGVREVFDDGEEEGKEVSPVMHQTCHHWAYEIRQGDLDNAWAGRR